VFLAEDTAIDPNIVTPGVVGFVATILVAVVTILLLWDMVRRIRRQRYQAEIEAKLDAEQAAASKK
jgi:capsular polysaccharide biosynthesis protein